MTEEAKSQILKNLDAIIQALKNGSDVLIKTTANGIKILEVKYKKVA